MSVEALQRRIKTSHDLREIVSNMKTLSSVSILQYEQANTVLDKYQQNLYDAFHALAIHNGIPQLLTRPSPHRRHLFIIIGSDNGMVGRFNRELIEKTKNFIRENHISEADSYCITAGRRLSGLAESAGFNIIASYIGANSVKAVTALSEQIIIKIEETVRKNKISDIYIAYHHRQCGTGTVTELQKILPPSPQKLKQIRQKKWTTNNIPMLPLPPQKMFAALLNEMLIIGIAKHINASLAAEHFTRMTNMQNAEKNIDENLEQMNLQYQQARQEEITSELIDVISGANTMQGGNP